MLDLPAGRGTAGYTACGRGHGGELPACSDACASSAAFPNPWRLHLPADEGGYHPDRAPPVPSGYWKLRPRSMWCCFRIAKAPAQKDEKWDERINRKRLLENRYQRHTAIFTCVSKPKESARSSVMRLFCRKTRCESYGTPAGTMVRFWDWQLTVMGTG